MDSSPEMSPYDLMVRKNIEENRQVLKSLGLLNSASASSESKSRKTSTPKRIPRKNFAKDASHVVLPAVHTRRSSLLLKSIGFNEFDQVSCCNNDEENTPPHKKAKTVCEPVFGEIEGVSVGDSWMTRLECSAVNVHRPTVAGIHGKLGEGCYSLALSGGYEDDLDYGVCFTYTGSGGRDLRGTKSNPKNLRTAPQSKDQILDGTNAALASNIESKKPIRVIRGYKLQSPFAPQEGYRYDGLYSVEKCWMATGLSGFKVCKFALKRLPNQDPPPWEINMSDLDLENGQPLQHPTENPVASEENSSSTAINTPQKVVASPNKSLRSSSCKDQRKENSQDQKPARGQEKDKDTTTKENGELDEDTNEPDKNDSTIKDVKSDKVSPKMKISKCPKSTPSVSPPVGILRPTENDEVGNTNDHLQNGFHHFSESENVRRKLKLNGVSNGNKKSSVNQSSIHFTPVRSKRNLVLNHSLTGAQEIKSCVVLAGSCEKKVRFSPRVHYTDDEGNGTIESIESFSNDEENCNQTRGAEQYTSSDGKRQTSILNYFERVKKSEIQPPKPIVNPKSLRGNRVLSFTTICTRVETKPTSGNPCVSPNKNNQSVDGEKPLLNGVIPDKSSSAGSINRPKSSSQKRKYSLDRNRENMFDTELLSRRGPSLMENLIKQNNDKLRLHHQNNSKKRKVIVTPSPVKACFVNLLRLEDSFLGWDNEGSLFHGYSKKDQTVAQERSDILKKSLQKVQDSKCLLKWVEPVSDHFHGWDLSKEDFMGTSGLVPIAFMIDKLSEYKSGH